MDNSPIFVNLLSVLILASVHIDQESGAHKYKDPPIFDQETYPPVNDYHFFKIMEIS